MVSSFLPADQGHALMKAAAAVMELHAECKQQKSKRRQSVKLLSQSSIETIDSIDPRIHSPLTNTLSIDMLNQAVLADPAGTIFSVPELQVILPRYFHEELLGSNFVQKDSITNRDTFSSTSSSNGEMNNFFGEKNASRYSGLDLRKIVVAAYADGKPNTGAFDGI